MAANTIRNIIFDYGGVIFEIEHERTARSFEELGLPQVRHAFSHAVQEGIFLDFETGGLDPAAFRDAIREMGSQQPGGQQRSGRQRIDQQLSDRQIDEAWNAMLLGVPEGNIPLLMQLKNQYRTFLLSNNNPIHQAACAEMLRERWGTGIEDCMEKAYFSHLMRLRKPDAEAYAYVLEANGLRPEETVFIDDTAVNIEMAKELGMQTRLVTRNAPLREVVESLGQR